MPLIGFPAAFVDGSRGRSNAPAPGPMTPGPGNVTGSAYWPDDSVSVNVADLP